MTTFNTQRVLHWRLHLEEFNSMFLYKTDTSNILMDALSRIPANTHCHTVARHLPAHTPLHVSQLLANDQTLVQQLVADTLTATLPLTPNSILTSTPELAECLLNHAIINDDGNLPFHFATL